MVKKAIAVLAALVVLSALVPAMAGMMGEKTIDQKSYEDRIVAGEFEVK